MKLKGLRIAAGKTQPDLVEDARTYGLDKRVDAPLYSRCENGVVLLKPQDAAAVAQALGITVADIYTPEDVDYRLSQPQIGRKPDRRKKCGRLDVRLDIEVARRFEWALGVMGVTNKTDWVNKCVIRFIKAAERREKKIAACAGTQTTKQVVTPHNISTSV